MYGGKDQFDEHSKSLGVTRNYNIDFEGIANFIESQYKNSDSKSLRRWARDYMDKVDCQTCSGSRLKPESLCFKINNKNIQDLTSMDIEGLFKWFKNIDAKLSKTQHKIAEEIIKEIKTRLQFLLDSSISQFPLHPSAL